MLALPDEDRAREAGRRVRESFRRDPRPPPVQHKKIWELMKPGAEFSKELDRFLDLGVPRKQLSMHYRRHVFTFKLMLNSATLSCTSLEKEWNATRAEVDLNNIDAK